eukprot:scaffold22560_cov203-Skeletonema_marinoi.AAC.1
MAGIIIDSFGPDGSYISAFFSHNDTLIHISGLLLYPRQKSILMQDECNYPRQKSIRMGDECNVILRLRVGGENETAKDASYRPFIILQRAYCKETAAQCQSSSRGVWSIAIPISYRCVRRLGWGVMLPKFGSASN